MKKTVVILLAVLAWSSAAFSQKYFTKTGTISFEAGTSVEDIDAINKSATSVMDVATGRIEFAVLVKGFEFKRALMQEHFNENYMESSKYPKAVFKGNITNIKDIDFKKPGTYPATVSGIMEIHGVKKQISTKGAIKILPQGAQAITAFNININDYKIAIPGVVKDKISPIAKVKVNCNYTLLK